MNKFDQFELLFYVCSNTFCQNLSSVQVNKTSDDQILYLKELGTLCIYIFLSFFFYFFVN